jgi:hypothetical protein
MDMNRAPQMRPVFGSDTALVRWAIDELVECYLSWREECRAVQLAYQRWADCRRVEGRLSYAAYVAALDREERAARSYADHVERLGGTSGEAELGQSIDISCWEITP